MKPMDNIDKSLKSHLAKSLDRRQAAAAEAHPADDKLADYLAGSLSAAEAASIEKHASGCKECLAKISLAIKADGLFKDNQLPPASAPALKKAAQITAQAKTRAKARRKNLWLLATIAAFGLSFVFPRYFLQCLAAAILLGIKWIMESENMRTLILVLDSWRRHQHDHDEEISQRLKDRGDVKLNSK